MSRGIVREAARLVAPLWFQDRRDRRGAAARRRTHPRVHERHRSSASDAGAGPEAQSGRGRRRGHPARGHGRVLRVGRAAPTSRASRQAGRRGWHRPPRRRRGRVVRGPPLRRPLGDVVGPRPAVRPDVRCSCLATTRLRRGERSTSSTSSPRYTPLVEPLSLDEAFLDVTGSDRLFGPGSAIGWQIRATVVDRLGLSCSVGVAPNKFLAKMASVEAKPRARPAWRRARPRGVRGAGRAGNGLPRSVAGRTFVGRRSGHACSGSARLGVVTIGDLALSPRSPLRASVGADRHRAPARARRRPRRPTGRAANGRPSRSSHEETYATDLYDRDEIRTEVVRLSDAVASRLRTSGRGRPHDHGQGSRLLVPHGQPVQDGAPTASTRRLRSWLSPTRWSKSALPTRRRAPAGRRLRRSSRSRPNNCSSAASPPSADPAAPWGDASRAIDRVRRRFGAAAIGPASSLAGKGLRLVQRGQRQWGPSADEEE